MKKLSVWFKELPKWAKIVFFPALILGSLILFLSITLIVSLYLDSSSRSQSSTTQIDLERSDIGEELEKEFVPSLVDLEIDLLGVPLKINNKFDITDVYQDEYIKDPIDLDESFIVGYKTGSIKKGRFMESEQLAYNLSGYDIYVLSTLEEHDYVYAVRIAYLDDNSPIFILSQDQREPGDLLDISLKPNVINISSYKITDQSLFGLDIFKGMKYNSKKVSDNGNTFTLGAPIFKPLVEELSKLEEIDSFGEVKIYNYKVDIEGYSVVESPEGFLQKVVYVPSIVEYVSSDPKVEIVLDKTGEETEHFYDYISIGGCSENDLEVANVKDTELRSIGKAKDGNPIYVKINRNDSYLKKLYNEDYLSPGSEMNKYNYITEDDITPFTYEQFVDAYPILYWKDPFGRYIMFARRDFVITGGCAKPAIYLYPEEKTSLNVKVIPNGLLTFTSPKYEVGGWNINVGTDGTINYKGGKYEYLWWDSISNGYYTPSNGWVIERGNFETFITEKLQEMGLNEKEISDFNEFWVPLISKENTQYLYITFLFNSEVNQIAKLEFSIQPDNIFRVFMLYESMDKYKEVRPLKIEKVSRTGFTVVEWGGAKER